MCGLAIDVEDGAVGAIRGDGDDPFSRGHVCPKALALKDIHEDPDRLRRPLLREGDRHRELGWDEALDLAAERLREVAARHGRDAVALYQGNPTVHNWGSMLFGPELARALGSKHLFSATSVDQLPHHLAAHAMFGHQLLLPIPDLDRAELLVIVGANPAVSNGSLMTAPGALRRLRAVRERGGRVVVIDPRRSETAALADAHHFIRPGTDALLLAALAHCVFADGHVRLRHCEGLVLGLDALAEFVAPFTPERVAAACGVPAAATRALAAELAGAERACVYARMGTSTQAFGTLCNVLVNALNLITGNLDRAGGAMFTSPAVDLLRLTGRGSPGRTKSRVRGLPSFGGELPVAALAEEMETPGPGQIRALVTSAGNPVLSTPNGRRLERALGALDFMVSIDLYLNETTRHAQLILPPTGPLEHDHYDLAFHALAVRNTAKYSPALLPPAPDARHDWQILSGLALRLLPRGLAGLRARARVEAMARLGPRRLLDLALRVGEHGARSPARLSLAALERAPHGIDLGPLEPRLPKRLFTRPQRIRIPGALLSSEAERLARLADTPAPDGLVLIGRRELRSHNSWLHNSARLVKGPERCALQVHPDDARARGLDDGAAAHVRSRTGALDVRVEITADVMPGVVSLPHGWGHDRPGARLSVAATRPGVSANDLTDDQAVDAPSGNAALSGVPVEVTRAAPR